MGLVRVECGTRSDSFGAESGGRRPAVRRKHRRRHAGGELGQAEAVKPDRRAGVVCDDTGEIVRRPA